jgi:hypothetical protein
MASGIGFVDVALTFSGGLLHVVELKILKGTLLLGPAQLNRYMQHERRNEGWLILFDARKDGIQTPVPSSLGVTGGTVRVVRININPTAPSKLR